MGLPVLAWQSPSLHCALLDKAIYLPPTYTLVSNSYTSPDPPYSSSTTWRQSATYPPRSKSSCTYNIYNMMWKGVLTSILAVGVVDALRTKFTISDLQSMAENAAALESKYTRISGLQPDDAETADTDPSLLYPAYSLTVPIDHFHNDSIYEPHVSLHCLASSAGAGADLVLSQMVPSTCDTGSMQPIFKKGGRSSCSRAGRPRVWTASRTSRRALSTFSPRQLVGLE